MKLTLITLISSPTPGSRPSISPNTHQPVLITASPHQNNQIWSRTILTSVTNLALCSQKQRLVGHKRWPPRKEMWSPKSLMRTLSISRINYSIYWTILRLMQWASSCRWKRICWTIKRSAWKVILISISQCTKKSISSCCRQRKNCWAWVGKQKKKQSKSSCCQSILGSSTIG